MSHCHAPVVAGAGGVGNVASMRTIGWITAVLVLSTSCSFARYQERRIDARFERAGLVTHTVTLGDATVRYRIGGEGPPLLLLHGFGGDGASGWHEQLPLADEHTLIVPDLLWFGGSTSTATPSVAEQVRMAVAVLDHEGIERADVAGISYGGITTWLLVDQHPERVGRVVLIDTPGDVWTDEDEAAMHARLGISSASELVVPTGPDGVARLLDLAYHEPPNVPGFILSDVYQNMFTQQADAKRALIAEVESQAVAPAWESPPPTLVVWGEFDPLFTLDVGERLAARVGGDLHVVRETDHAPNLERPDDFNAAVRAFLSGPIPAPAPAPAPGFAFAAAPLSDADRASMIGTSWREGCPIPLDDLRRVTLSHHGFDGAVHQGVLIVHADAVDPVRAAFGAAFDAGFPIERIEPVDVYGGDDDASMAANNTSAFNCRPVTGGTTWSEHSYGRAIDVNPLQNPYTRGDVVLPPESRRYLDRDPAVPGLLVAESAMVVAFDASGWGWGGRWPSPDFQHLSSSGR